MIGTPLFAVAVWQVFVPPDGASAAYLLGWSALLYLAFTMIDLPHKAWGAELSTDYDERTRITSWREALASVQAHLMLIYGCVPALLMASGVLFLRRFPITRERHAEVRAALEARSETLTKPSR